MFEGDFKLNYHLAPPLLASATTRASWSRSLRPRHAAQLGLLARLKGLRGTASTFGRTEERRTERALIGQYRASIEELLPTLSAANHATGWRSPAFPSRSRATAM
jgi:indolepyruvate ferredoxin oxidoreductase